MHPLRIRVDRIIDFGTVVSLVGVDTETAKIVTLHIDHRPFAVFERACPEAGLSPLVEYEADRLVVRLDMTPWNEGQHVRHVESDSPSLLAAFVDQASRGAGE